MSDEKLMADLAELAERISDRLAIYETMSSVRDAALIVGGVDHTTEAHVIIRELGRQRDAYREALTELRSRIHGASVRLTALVEEADLREVPSTAYRGEADRLRAKRSGVDLAESYLDDTLRLLADTKKGG